jgi:hypothetical protein
MVQFAMVPAFRSQLFLQPLLELAAGHKVPPVFTGAWTHVPVLLQCFILQYVHLPAVNYTADHFDSQSLALEVPLQLFFCVLFHTELVKQIQRRLARVRSTSCPLAPHEIIFSPSLLTLEDIVQASPHNLLGVVVSLCLDCGGLSSAT